MAVEKKPFLHTIEVPPGATVVADFNADASGGQWFFHCHHLYHMMAGMAQVFQYSTIMEDYKKVQAENPCLQCSDHVPEFVMHPLAHHPHIHQSSFIDMG